MAEAMQMQIERWTVPCSRCSTGQAEMGKISTATPPETEAAVTKVALATTTPVDLGWLAVLIGKKEGTAWFDKPLCSQCNWEHGQKNWKLPPEFWNRSK